MLGGVPINVTMPPSSVAKDNGISTSDGDRRAFTALRKVTGSISASAPTLFMKLDSSAPSALEAAT